MALAESKEIYYFLSNFEKKHEVSVDILDWLRQSIHILPIRIENREGGEFQKESAVLNNLSDSDLKEFSAAIDYAKKIKPVYFEGYPLYENVYDLMLSIGLSLDRQSRPEVAYRGHPNHKYQLLPSIFRDKPSGEDIKIRLLELYHYIVHLGSIESRFKTLSPLQQVATARHYGAFADLLDCTRSFKVAAFFAAREPHQNGELGVIIKISEGDIFYGAFVETVTLPEWVERPHTQQALFLRSSFWSYLESGQLGFGILEKWLFRQSVRFEDPAAGITENALMRPESALTKEAEAYWASRGR